MNKILYTKFSNERTPEFSVKTDIIRYGDGSRKVKKSAVHPAADSHVRQLLHWREELDHIYQNTKLNACPCEWETDGVAFDFIEGKSLESILDQHLKQEQYEELFALIREYFSICRKAATEQFVETEEFYQVFGKVKLSGQLQCSRVSDIDMIFANVMSRGENWYLIDYEWCFDFPIPIDYILYRALHYYIYTRNLRTALLEKNIFELLGTDSGNIKEFEKMEYGFQRYIDGNVVPVRMLYQTMGEGCRNVMRMLMDSPIDYNGRKLQIFKNKGQGFIASDMQLLDAAHTEDGIYSLEVSVESDVTMIRMDLAECHCMIQLLSCQTVSGESKTDCRARLSHNGLDAGNGFFVFRTGDPWFWLDVEPQECSCALIQYRMFPFGERDAGVVDRLCQKVEAVFGQYAQEVDKNFHHEQEIDTLQTDLQSLKKEKEKLEQEAKELKEQLQTATQQLEDIQLSLSWKVTKPLRKTKELFQK